MVIKNAKAPVQQINRERITGEIEQTLKLIGSSAIDSVPYDTAWIARLSAHYPGYQFESALEWLREHQHPDGSWGSAVIHYYDRTISTLAAIAALRLAGKDPQDDNRIERGISFLWNVSGRLHHDAHDTIGFPVLAVPLINEALNLGMDVPRDLYRDAATIEKKLNLLSQDSKLWRYTTMAFSLEAIRSGMPDKLDYLEANGSVGTSPAATAALLLYVPKAGVTALPYLKHVLAHQGDGGAPTITPIDIFEMIWSLSYLRSAGAISTNHPEVQRALGHIWNAWNPDKGLGFSVYYSVPDLDDTAVGFTLLEWGGYSVNANVFASYEGAEYFHCYPGEIDPSLSVNIRTLAALRMVPEHSQSAAWKAKIIRMLRRQSLDGNFWFDKWHVSPYYLAYAAVRALHGLADDLIIPRIKWIARTQHADGGWGHFEHSTPEETAYALQALLFWDRTTERIDPAPIEAAAKYLINHLDDGTYVPLWISKCLYTPRHIVRSVILSALYGCLEYWEK